ncbi:HelD family protein [Saccharothrix algeriensis]|uniref:AAA family ATPase n=1 Tax=Saccharothrix algeriensis TaxID=173560 RepID=A0A8T8I1U7_9PSEU|nr:ATP-binding domain-containing protein [Saccharothrix algeriensis]MBM7810845.1 DNA helicase IV [Saccharothrix algeriensis]QTR04873.1 AAA family ATPase [Saccharothrix algeriensis]
MSSPSDDLRLADIESEQEYVSMLYGRLDDLREQSSKRLAGALRETGGTHQMRSERDTSVAMYSDQLAQYSAVENGLCFGRLDFHADDRCYIGRIGLFDEEKEYEPLLMDWRAPAARPFYLATAAAPDGVRRRRHLRTKQRKVVGLDDEVLDIGSVDPSRPSEGLTGEATLLAAVNASRTGQMGDIVATIQAEQDRIIRTELNGVVVVQGGPGTGKTAVALHRAAYLLYTHRRQLAKRGVLVVGPNPTFLRYIGQVLPSLGETGVLLSTVGELFPGLTAVGREPAATAALKGRIAMAEVVAHAVKDRQEAPALVEVPFEQDVLRLDRRTITAARGRARRTRRPHNEARRTFQREVIAALAAQAVARLGRHLLDQADVDDIRRELREDPGVQAAVARLWPTLTPQQLLEDLYATPKLLAKATPKLTAEERALLARPRGAEWTPADVPLLDEAAELLGEDDTEAKARAERQRRQAIDYAQGVLDILDLEDDADPDILMATDLVDAYRLAERHGAQRYETAAERAAADRTWTFGHVIVDEAQELSAMAWRTLMRRCPSKSMTVVGDIAQTGDVAGASSWHEVLSPYVMDRWKLTELTVNYRTPSEIMAVAADVLAAVDPQLAPPTSVRDSGNQPWSRRVGDAADALPTLVSAEVAAVGDGKLAVIVPAARVAALRAVVPGASDDLDAQVVVLGVADAKGLEFDSVLVVDPAGVLAESPRGASDLYVALTRATQRLGVVHEGDLPPVLGRLAVTG